MGIARAIAKYGIFRVGYMFVALIVLLNVFFFLKLLITRKGDDGKKLSKKEFLKSLKTNLIGFAIAFAILYFLWPWFSSTW